MKKLLLILFILLSSCRVIIAQERGNMMLLVSQEQFNNEAFGQELVTNGDFSSSSNWGFSNSGGTFGWSILGGRAICDNSATTPNRNLNQNLNIAPVIGRTYECKLDILQSDDNMLFIFAGQKVNLPTGTNLDYTFYITATSNSNSLVVFASTSDLQEIDNVSVKEAYLGPELISNCDFIVHVKLLIYLIQEIL